MKRKIILKEHQLKKLIESRVNDFNIEDIAQKLETIECTGADLKYLVRDILKNYGYEDIVFILGLKKEQIAIGHIENPSYHLNLEKSAIFLEKFHSSLQNLKLVLDKNIINPDDTALTKIYFKLKRFHLVKALAFGFKIVNNSFTKNLLSKNPSLFIFDLYRLGYFCQINSR
jgi:hypothetical protein